MNSVYMDLEYDSNCNIIEMAALWVQSGCIKNYFHCFVRNQIKNVFLYYKCAENSHCIHPSTLNHYGIPCELAMHELENFFANIQGSIIIKGHGNDMMQNNLEKLFPFLKRFEISFAQVNLPQWSVRQKLDSHISTYNMKIATNLIPCHRDNHSIKYNPSWMRQNKPANHTRIAKLAYGAHCALIDCFELSFYENALKNYCCDTHFHDLFLIEPIKPIVPTHDTTFNSLIVHSPLVFYDNE